MKNLQISFSYCPSRDIGGGKVSTDWVVSPLEEVEGTFEEILSYILGHKLFKTSTKVLVIGKNSRFDADIADLEPIENIVSRLKAYTYSHYWRKLPQMAEEQKNRTLHAMEQVFNQHD